MVAEFRRRTLLPLDDVLGHLKDSIPKLTRSVSTDASSDTASLASRRGEGFQARTVRGHEIGYVHIDICELRLTEGKLNMFLAIDRVSKFTYVEFHQNAGKMIGADFLRNRCQSIPLQNPHRAHRQWHGFR